MGRSQVLIHSLFLDSKSCEAPFCCESSALRHRQCTIITRKEIPALHTASLTAPAPHEIQDSNRKWMIMNPSPERSSHAHCAPVEEEVVRGLSMGDMRPRSGASGALPPPLPVVELPQRSGGATIKTVTCEEVEPARYRAPHG